jgi:homocysteine S-methyltransferase
MTDDPIARHLSRHPVLLLDGGLATELERRGADLDHPLWSARMLIERPEAIRALHLDYFLAGADVATTASYQASFDGLAREGHGAEEAAALMRDAVALAIEARAAFWSSAAQRERRAWPLVAASVGPYGAMLADGAEYRGHYGLSIDELADFHRPRLRVLAEAGPDLLACETLPALDEALALARVLDETPGPPAWIAFSCRDGGHTCQGEPIEDCARALEGCTRVAAIGVNCTAPAHVGELVRRLRAHTRKPVLAYPNSGEAWDPLGRRWLRCAGDAPFAAHAHDWYAQGARAIGGCCRTTPQDIAALRRWADALPRPSAPNDAASRTAGPTDGA